MGISPNVPRPTASRIKWILEQELAPVFHQSFSSPSATDDNLQLPLTGAGRARQLAPPSEHGRASENNT